MKRYLSFFLSTILLFNFSLAQNIEVNGNTVNVSQDISFPYWLDSLSTINIGNGVVEISVLEFSITQNNNGNSLNYIQTKNISSQQTVPSGMTWKVEGVLLDTNMQNIQSSNIYSISKPMALSHESIFTMSIGHALVYCDTLNESGYDDWILPNLYEILHVAGGGGILAGSRSSNWLTTISPIETSQFGGEVEYYKVKLSDGAKNKTTGGNFVRCVRYSYSSLTNNHTSTISSINNSISNKPTMLSSQSSNTTTLLDAMTYCENLVENGYDDWFVPSYEELFYLISGVVDIPNRTDLSNWTRSSSANNDVLLLTTEGVSNNTDPTNNWPRAICVRY